MFKKIVLLCLLIVSFSCKKETQKPTLASYKITATVDESVNGKKASIINIRKRTAIDSTIIKNGKFEFSGNVNSPDKYFIVVENASGAFPFILDNEIIEIEFKVDSIPGSKITKSKTNDIAADYFLGSKPLFDFNNELRKKYDRAIADENNDMISEIKKSFDSLVVEASKYDKSYIENNPNSVMSALTLERISAAKDSDLEEARRLHSNLSNEIKKTIAAQNVLLIIKREEENREKNKVTAVGSIAPNFYGRAPSGKDITLTDIKGKVIIIDFWASWCAPCRQENPNIVKMYNKYNKKGLEIIGVSLDKAGHESKWIEAIAYDKLTWPQVSNLKGWQDPIALQYKVSSIPATLVLDENYKILARNLRGKALENKIASLLK